MVPATWRATSSPRQVCARDEFGNRCHMPPTPAIRCKLICSSSDGAPIVVEASDAVSILPFARTKEPLGVVRPSTQSSPAQLGVAACGANEDKIQQQLSGLQMLSKGAGTSAADETAFETSLLGEVDIGRSPAAPALAIFLTA
jgi:hypothetical protein